MGRPWAVRGQLAPAVGAYPQSLLNRLRGIRFGVATGPFGGALGLSWGVRGQLAPTFGPYPQRLFLKAAGDTPLGVAPGTVWDALGIPWG